MKFAYSQNNFSSGELSPKLKGRNELKEYTNGAEILQNFIPMAQGGLTIKPGSQYIKDITADFDTSYDVEIFQFVPNRDECYLIAVGKDSGSATCVFKVYKQDASYPLGLTACTVNTDGAIGPQLLNLYTYGLTTLSELHYVQSGDFAFFTHSSKRVEPLVFVRTDSTTFEFTNYDRATAYTTERTIVQVRRMPFQAQNSNTSHILTTTGASAGVRTLTASGSGFAPFTSDWIGTWVRLSDGTTEIVGYISAYTSSTVVELTFDNPYSGAANIADYRWAWGSWSKKMGYPGSITLWQERLFFGGSLAEPTTVWATVAGNLFLVLNRKLVQDSSADTSGVGYFGAISSSDAFSFLAGSDLSGTISYLSADRYLKVGTNTAEIVVTPVDGIVGPANRDIKIQSFYGSKSIQPARITNAVIFCTAEGKKIEEVTFSEENASFAERELTVLADHLVYHERDSATQSSSSSQFKKMVYQRDRKCIWFTNTNGGLVGVVNNPSAGVLAWFKVSLGGTTRSIQGIACLPSPDGGANDALYMVVKRTINGSTKKYIERIGESFEQDNTYGEYVSNQRDLAICADSAIAVASATIGSGQTVIAVSHLEGETVVVTHKGIDVGEFVVTSGNITIPSELSNFSASKSTIVGLPFTAKAKTMPIEAGAQFGNGLTGLKRIDTLSARLYRTMKGKYTNSESVTYPFEYATESEALFIGVKKLAWNDSSKEDASVIIEQSDPYPMTILQLVMRGRTEE